LAQSNQKTSENYINRIFYLFNSIYLFVWFYDYYLFNAINYINLIRIFSINKKILIHISISIKL